MSRRILKSSEDTMREIEDGVMSTFYGLGGGLFSDPVSPYQGLVDDFDEHEDDWDDEDRDLEDEDGDLEDDDLEDYDLDEDEEDLDEEDLEGERFGVFERPLEDTDVIPSESFDPKMGRRAMANRARAALFGKGNASDEYGAGYQEGYYRALLDLGVPQEAAAEQFGKFKPFKLIGGAFKPIGKLVKSAGSGLLGGVGVQDLAFQAGSGLSSSLLPGFDAGAVARDAGASVAQGISEDSEGDESAIERVLAKRQGKDLGSDTEVTIEADGETLPPVYVADEEGFIEDVEEAEDLTGEPADSFVSDHPIEPADKFGGHTRDDFVSCQPSRKAASAASSALRYGVKSMNMASPRATESFVEDKGAMPYMYTDGSIHDSIYGELVAVPCPSCTKQGHSQCQLCEEFGAVLVPKSDLDSYAGVQYGLFFLIPLLGAAATGAAGVAGQWGVSKALEGQSSQDTPESVVKLARKALKAHNEGKEKNARWLVRRLDRSIARLKRKDPTWQTPQEILSLVETIGSRGEKMGAVRAIVPHGGY